MSKYCIFSDIHWSKNTSIVRSRGNKYSTRLELLIKSMNWVNELAVRESCDSMICLGDMMDKSQLIDEEISALREIKWNKLPSIYLVGNHESSVSSLDFSTVSIFRNKRVKIISKPEMLSENNYDLLFLPYITEDNRKELKSYIEELKASDKELIIFSHNDLKGLNYGAFVSKIGFDIDEINKYCSLFLNGHLHNSEWVSKKILNVGSLSAHNFTNDSYRYKYGAWILDTDTLSLKFFENPYSLNFYKIDIENEKDLSKLVDLKSNAVLSIKCDESTIDNVRKYLESVDVVESKLVVTSNTNSQLSNITTGTIDVSDHLVKFKDFILNREDITNLDIFKEELLEVCK